MIMCDDIVIDFSIPRPDIEKVLGWTEMCRVTSLIRNRPFPGMVLLQGPKGARFLMSEVTL